MFTAVIVHASILLSVDVQAPPPNYYRALTHILLHKTRGNGYHGYVSEKLKFIYTSINMMKCKYNEHVLMKDDIVFYGLILICFSLFLVLGAHIVQFKYTS